MEGEDRGEGGESKDRKVIEGQGEKASEGKGGQGIQEEAGRVKHELHEHSYRYLLVCAYHLVSDTGIFW